MQICPCASNKPIGKCCGRFLTGQQHAKTPEQLMRSRFTAFYMGDHGQYLIDTWHPTKRRGLNALDLNAKDTDWQTLEIIEKSQTGNQGIVEFKAWYKTDTGEMACLHERSRFERVGGKWYYVDGEFLK